MDSPRLRPQQTDPASHRKIHGFSARGGRLEAGRLPGRYQLSNCRTLPAWRLLTINSWPLLRVTSHR